MLSGSESIDIHNLAWLTYFNSMKKIYRISNDEHQPVGELLADPCASSPVAAQLQVARLVDSTEAWQDA